MRLWKSFVALFILAVGGTARAEAPPPLGLIYEDAVRDFQNERYPAALLDLDRFDSLATRTEDKLESLNLRGAILTRSHGIRAGARVLQRALDVDGNCWSARFNLGEISFLEKDWVEARCQFELALAQKAGIDDETRALLRYKILLTCLLDGNRAQARRMKAVLAASSDEPASYYAAAATAYQTGREGKAQRKIREAGKRFSPATNKLYAESFVELGWETTTAGTARANFDIASPEDKVASLQHAARRNAENAEMAFRRQNTDLALEYLEQSDPRVALAPDTPSEQKRWQVSIDTLQAALAGQPTRRGLEFAAAQANLRKGDYRQARNRLERLFTSTPDAKSRAAELLRFETFLTLLLEDKESQAQTMMDRFPYTGATPALYYAEAAWAFKHGNNARGDDWIAAARKSYPPALNDLFASALRDVGWIEDFRATARAERRLSHVAGFIDPLIPRTG